MLPALTHKTELHKTEQVLDCSEITIIKFKERIISPYLTVNVMCRVNDAILRSLDKWTCQCHSEVTTIQGWLKVLEFWGEFRQMRSSDKWTCQCDSEVTTIQGWLEVLEVIGDWGGAGKLVIKRLTSHYNVYDQYMS